MNASLSTLVAIAGDQPVNLLTFEHIHAACSAWRFARHTLCNYSKCLRRFLVWLERLRVTQATISDAVPHWHQPPHRTVKATDEERNLLLSAAFPHMRFFLLLCADHGLRHRFAATITPRHYNPVARAITFTTKGGHTQTLPVSTEVQRIFASIPATADPDLPMVYLLRADHVPHQIKGATPHFARQWQALKKRCGIRPELRIHDLRRTVAEDVWQATKNLRLVQAQLGHKSISTTAKYLAHTLSADELRPVISEVAALRVARQHQPTVSHLQPQPASVSRCHFCPQQPNCKPEAPLCARKEFDA